MSAVIAHNRFQTISQRRDLGKTLGRSPANRSAKANFPATIARATLCDACCPWLSFSTGQSLKLCHVNALDLVLQATHQQARQCHLELRHPRPDLS